MNNGLLVAVAILVVVAIALVWIRRFRPDRRSVWSSRRKRLTDDVLDRMASGLSEATDGEESRAAGPSKPSDTEEPNEAEGESEGDQE